MLTFNKVTLKHCYIDLTEASFKGVYVLEKPYLKKHKIEITLEEAQHLLDVFKSNYEQAQRIEDQIAKIYPHFKKLDKNKSVELKFSEKQLKNIFLNLNKPLFLNEKSSLLCSKIKPLIQQNIDINIF